MNKGLKYLLDMVGLPDALKKKTQQRVKATQLRRELPFPFFLVKHDTSIALFLFKCNK